MNTRDNYPRVLWYVPWMYQEGSPGPFPVKSANEQPRGADVAQGCIPASLGYINPKDHTYLMLLHSLEWCSKSNEVQIRKCVQGRRAGDVG